MAVYFLGAFVVLVVVGMFAIAIISSLPSRALGSLNDRMKAKKPDLEKDTPAH